MNGSAAPAGSRMERKKEQTRHRIVATALELFKQQGVDGTTMEQIARQADIAKGTLYNYFPVKEAIISAYIQQSFREKYSQRILQLSNMLGVRGRMTFMLGILMEGVQEQKEIFEKYLVYQIQNMISVRRDAVVPSGFRELAREIIIRGQNDGEIRSDLPLDVLVALVEFIFVEVAQEFYMKPDSFNVHNTIESCVDLFMNGAKPPK